MDILCEDDLWSFITLSSSICRSVMMMMMMSAVSSCWASCRLAAAESGKQGGRTQDGCRTGEEEEEEAQQVRRRSPEVMYKHVFMSAWCWKRVLQEWRRPAAEEEEDEQETGGQTGRQTGFFKAPIIYIWMTPVNELTVFSVFLSAASCLFVTLWHQTSSCWSPWQQPSLEDAVIVLVL